jgi:RND family efflux transporter MFP subunit
MMCATACLLAGCTPRTLPRSADDDSKLPRLETALPQRGTLDYTSELTATVEAFEKAELCSQVRGAVSQIDVDIGRRIKRGETLLTLDIPDLVADRDHKAALKDQAEKLTVQAEINQTVAGAELTEAKAQEQRYRADFVFRDLQHKRILELSKRETLQPQLSEEARQQREAAEAALTASLAQIQTKQARLKAAEGEVEVARSRLKAAQAELARAAVLVDFGSLRAPFDGVITKRWVDAGATIKDPGMPLLTVMRTDRVRVILDVPEREVSYLHAEAASDSAVAPTPATVHIPALADAAFEGKVTLMSGALDPATRTMRVEVHLDNRDGRLRPQMTGTARLVLAHHDRVLTVPSAALRRAGDRAEVYYIDAPEGDPPRGVVKRAVVELGLDDGLRVEIRKGLTGQERVIIKGNGVVRVGETAIAAER